MACTLLVNSDLTLSRLIAFILAVSLPQSALAADDWTIVHAGQLLAQPGNSPAEKQSLMIEAGFTTVRNLGGGSEMLALRDTIAQGIVKGPRVFAVGGLISATGSHSNTTGFRPEISRLNARPEICNGIADCRRSVRLLVKNRADHIRVAVTGGVVSETGAGLNQQMFKERSARSSAFPI